MEIWEIQMERARAQSVSTHSVILHSYKEKLFFKSDLQTEKRSTLVMCGNSRSRVDYSNAVTHIHTSTKTPVGWRQLKVTVQAACKQSKDQNRFQVVREDQEKRF